MTATLNAGDTRTVHRTFTLKDVRVYAALSADSGAVTTATGLTESSLYGKPVVPALLVASLFSRLIQDELPVREAHLIGEMLRFTLPVYVGETVTATIEAVSIRADRGLVQIATRASTTRGICVSGEAVVSFRPPPASAA